MSYVPASSSDEAILLSLANSAANSFPAYLIKLNPELRINGLLIATGKSIGMAKILPFNIILTSPVSGENIFFNKSVVGAYAAIVLDLSVTVSSQLDKLAARVKDTKAKIDSNDLSGLAKDAIIGDFLYGIGLSYWGVTDFYNKIASQVNSVSDVRLPSEGIFTYDLEPNFLFDVPVTAIPKGFTTDIIADQHIAIAKDGDTSKELAFMAAIGTIGSRMEASIYDLAFNKTYSGKGISTAHIFEYANQQGIPLYVIDGSNINSVLPMLNVSEEVKTDIQNAVNAGKIVTVPKTSITKDGWTGAGYLIFDKTSGSGAYKISGGLSGGGYNCNCFGFSPTAEFLIGIALAGLGLVMPVAAAVLAVIFSGISLASLICSINHVPNLSQEEKDILIYAAWTVFFIGVALAALSVFVYSVPFFAASLALIIYTMVTSWAILKIANILSDLNSRQQN